MNSFVKHIFNLYIFLNIHVALSVVSLYFIFNQNNFHKEYALFLFFSTVFSYGLIRIMFLKNNRSQFLFYYYRYSYIFKGILFFSFLCSLFFFMKLPIQVRFSIVPLGLITLLYQSYFPFFSFRQNGIIKIITVSFVWAMLTVVIPGIFFSANSTSFRLEFLFVFLYILLLTLSFDQRDILIDDKALKTFPQAYPEYKSYFYLILGSVLSVLLFFIFDGFERFLSEIILLISLFLCWFSDENKKFYYTTFLIEGIPVLWALVLFLQKKGF